MEKGKQYMNIESTVKHLSVQTEPIKVHHRLLLIYQKQKIPLVLTSELRTWHLGLSATLPQLSLCIIVIEQGQRRPRAHTFKHQDWGKFQDQAVRKDTGLLESRQTSLLIILWYLSNGLWTGKQTY